MSRPRTPRPDGALTPPKLKGQALRHARGGAITTDKRISAVERHVEWLRLRRSGLGYAELMERYNAEHGTNYSSQAGMQAVLKYLSRLQAEANETAADIRTIEAMRLDELQAAYWQIALMGDMQAALFCLKVMESRRRLFGVDAQPERGAPLVAVNVEAPTAERLTLDDVKPLLEAAGYELVAKALPPGGDLTAGDSPAITDPQSRP